MPKASEYGPKSGKGNLPKFLRASDLAEPATYTIAAVETKVLKGETKPVVTFKETDRPWVVNKTNMAAFVKKYGDIELEELIGKKVILAAVPTTFQGEQTSGIRVVG